MQSLIDASSSFVERCLPRRSHLLLSSANQRSARFLQGAVGRGEVDVEEAVAHEPAVNLRRLVGREVVDDEVDVEVPQDGAVRQVHKAPELFRQGSDRSSPR